MSLGGEDGGWKIEDVRCSESLGSPRFAGKLDDTEWADFRAPGLNFRRDKVSYLPCLRHALPPGSSKCGRVREIPAEPLRYTREVCARFRAGLVTYGDNHGKQSAGHEGVRGASGFFVPDIDANFPHHFDGQRVEFAGMHAGALGFKEFRTHVVQQCLGHLASGAVVGANKQDTLSQERSRIGIGAYLIR